MKAMRVLILGGDGYLGWATAMSFSRLGFEVAVVDNYFRRLFIRCPICTSGLNCGRPSAAFPSRCTWTMSVIILSCSRFLRVSIPRRWSTMPSGRPHPTPCIGGGSCFRSLAKTRSYHLTLKNCGDDPHTKTSQLWRGKMTIETLENEWYIST
jgi:hypothetical protein